MAVKHRRVTRELLFGAFLGPQRASEDPAVYDRILAAVEAETLQAGDVLYREGDAATHVHFMSEGRVRLKREGYADWVYEGWWVIGTADLLIDRPRTRTAYIEAETRFFRLPSAFWFSVNRDQPEALLLAVTGFAEAIAALRADLAPDGGFASAARAPASLAADTTSLAARVRVLASISLFRHQPIQLLVELARVCERVTLAAGDVATPARGAPARLSVVTRGLIEVRHDEPHVRGTFGPGELVGGSLFVAKGREGWSAHAIEASELLSFAVDDLFDLLDERLDGMRALMTAAAIEREEVCEALASRRGELLLR